ncbi:Holliday junction branch migration protein RuvA [Beduini massiliensis]|uniref:Holliday junction branch migration protein RuvA n=1 Tax=Beduini massiliensis TaxID=1585974 RepID=UPI00059A97A6|nr:Holliday junction branch migration protein RuvA [Beduini massiliensis]
MYSYIKGMVTMIFKDHIVLENQGIGYMIYVPNPYSFKTNSDMTVYIYQQVKEDGHLLFGFKSLEEKELFLKLISVKGIGPKTAVGALATLEVERIVGAIESGNINFLKKIPGIGPKAAGQIILDLQGKIVLHNEPSINPAFDEAIEVLVALGYREADVVKIMKKIEDDALDTNGYVKQALSLLVK